MFSRVLYGNRRVALWQLRKNVTMIMGRSSALCCPYSDLAAKRSRFGKKVTEDRQDVRNSNGQDGHAVEAAAKANLNPSLHDKSKNEARTSNKVRNGISEGKDHGDKTQKKQDTDKQHAKRPESDKHHHAKKEPSREVSQEAGAKSQAGSGHKDRHRREEKPKVDEQSKTTSVKNKVSKRKKDTNGLPKVKLDIPSFLSVTNLATILRVRVPDLLGQLEELGFENMSNDYILDGETASLIAQEYGFEVNQDDSLGADLFPSPDAKDSSTLKPRSPVVTIMGHVDHGKTTILDYLRKSSIAQGEQGGITQHIGAFVVNTRSSKKSITFLDTPGHAAFLKMRERGANMTDIVILVVAAEDSVMPQTIEAIKHTKNAGVPMIVAINKCDKEEANPDKVVADLSRHGVDVEDYGGEVPVVRVSAKTGLGMKDLEETIVTVAELLELKSEVKDVPAEGWILESEIKKGLGNCATFLVKKGKLKRGMFLVAGTTWCKVRVMNDENGKTLNLAGPSTPVEISGWKEVPEAGDFAIEAKDESFAKKVVSNRERRKQQMEEAEQVDEMNSRRLQQLKDAHREEKIQEYQRDGFTMEEIKDLDPDLFESKEETKKIVNFIIKADVSGSSEAVRQSIEGLGNEEVSSEVLYDEVGAPTESDIERARSSHSQILVFNLKVPKDIASSASAAGVEIKEFDIIYHLIEDVVKTLTDNLPPKFETKVTSKAAIKKLFDINLKGKESMTIAGSRITEGIFKKSAEVRLMRAGKEVYRGKIKQLKVEKDDVAEVRNGAECGICLDGNPDMHEGDVIETLLQVPIKRHL
ncbi:DEKNAAC102400 [Brettanomyces naardenensis]|uniref:Translation initiation factor IF-2, mitochondrial n=1 Tax=Brettanomyces naardenensis TaxID=13370 RepID=A0A448YK82_BRENA|nr:DEKNAAC102400 [Brettanomyces naardenensis]